VNGQEKVLSMFAFLVVDDDGTEGVPSIETPIGHMPMMGADLARMAVFKPIAQRWARENGKPVRLVHFSVRTEQEVYEPDGSITRVKS